MTARKDQQHRRARTGRERGPEAPPAPGALDRVPASAVPAATGAAAATPRAPERAPQRPPEPTPIRAPDRTVLAPPARARGAASPAVLRGAEETHVSSDPATVGPGRLTRRVRILGLGIYAPERVLDNDELALQVDTSDEWIRTRTGIRERRIAAQGETTSDLAAHAAREALQEAGLEPSQLELILVATATPDTPVPPTACHLQRKLGAEKAVAFDISAACTGFVVTLMTAHQMLAAGAYSNALVVGAEVLSAITDWQARESCVLFGDGAGAVVLDTGAGEGPVLVDHLVGMDGTGVEQIEVPAGGSLRPTSHETIERREHFLRMNGRGVFRFAVERIPRVVREICARNGLRPEELDLIVPHQANLRILEAAAKDLGIGMERFVVNIERYGNTSTASIPLALVEAERAGRLHRGDRVLLVAFGAGLSWGASLLAW